MRAELIGHFEPCMTDIYLHIDARTTDYIRTRTRMADMAERPPDGVPLDKMPNHCAMELPAGVIFLIDQVITHTPTPSLHTLQ